MNFVPKYFKWFKRISFPIILLQRLLDFQEFNALREYLWKIQNFLVNHDNEIHYKLSKRRPREYLHQLWNCYLENINKYVLLIET